MERVYSISKDNLRWIRHESMIVVKMDGNLFPKSSPHPSKIWKERGMNHVIKAVPEIMGDCWMLLVKDWDGELEEYEDELTLTTDNDGYWSCFGLKIEE
jgi:hypothetical protein